MNSGAYSSQVRNQGLKQLLDAINTPKAMSIRQQEADTKRLEAITKWQELGLKANDYDFKVMKADDGTFKWFAVNKRNPNERIALNEAPPKQISNEKLVEKLPLDKKFKNEDELTEDLARYATALDSPDASSISKRTYMKGYNDTAINLYSRHNRPIDSLLLDPNLLDSSLLDDLKGWWSGEEAGLEVPLRTPNGNPIDYNELVNKPGLKGMPLESILLYLYKWQNGIE